MTKLKKGRRCRRPPPRRRTNSTNCLYALLLVSSENPFPPAIKGIFMVIKIIIDK